MNCEYVRQYYGVPACIGRRVMVYSKPGIIAEDRGNYIGVNLDTDKPGRVSNYHPTDKRGVPRHGQGAQNDAVAATLPGLPALRLRPHVLGVDAVQEIIL
jgi:hypothetical protein